MGTNYYLWTDVCSECARPAEKLHVGKASAGWRFLLMTHPDHGLTSWDTWRQALCDDKNLIMDEYGKRISFDDFETMVVSRQHLKRHSGAMDVDNFDLYDREFS